MKYTQQVFGKAIVKHKAAICIQQDRLVSKEKYAVMWTESQTSREFDPWKFLKLSYSGQSHFYFLLVL